MRHLSWNTLVMLIGRIAERFGDRIYDNRCGETWDAGQSVCAEAYGPDWCNSRQFRKANERSEEDPAPQEGIDAALRLLSEDVPPWVGKKEEAKEGKAGTKGKDSDGHHEPT